MTDVTTRDRVWRVSYVAFFRCHDCPQIVCYVYVARNCIALQALVALLISLPYYVCEWPRNGVSMSALPLLGIIKRVVDSSVQLFNRWNSMCSSRKGQCTYPSSKLSEEEPSHFHSELGLAKIRLHTDGKYVTSVLQDAWLFVYSLGETGVGAEIRMIR